MLREPDRLDVFRLGRENLRGRAPRVHAQQQRDQPRHDRPGEHHHDDRIRHRRLHPALDAFAFFHETREPAQHLAHDAARLPRLHHVDVKPVEKARMVPEAVGKTPARTNRAREILQHRAKRLVPFLPRQHFQRPQQRHARLIQGRHLPSETRQPFRTDGPPPCPPRFFSRRRPPRAASRRRHRPGLRPRHRQRGRRQPAGFELRRRFLGARTLQSAAACPSAAGLDGGVGKSRHRQVYFITSSAVVAPANIARLPSSRSVRIPSAIACRRMSWTRAFSPIRSRIGSVTGNHSNSPSRPR